MKNEANILFVGDLVLQENDELKLSEGLRDLFKEHELISCNLEGPVLGEKSKPILKAGSNIHQKSNVAKEVLANGFNVINLSNNHIMDYGKEGLNKTLKEFPKDITVGAGNNFKEAYKLLIKTINGIKIGFLSFCEWDYGAITTENEDSPGFAWINHPKVDNIITDSKKNVNFLIVQCHAGEEEIKIPQPIWRKRYKQLIDLGADIIIGHHPHVPQPIEKYKEKIIFYSLGNFYFKKMSKKESNQNYILVLKINTRIYFEIIPIIQEGNLIKVHSNDKMKIFLLNYFEKVDERDYLKQCQKIEKRLWENRYKIYFCENRIKRVIINFIKKLLKKEIIPINVILKQIKNKESHNSIIKNYYKNSS